MLYTSMYEKTANSVPRITQSMLFQNVSKLCQILRAVKCFEGLLKITETLKTNIQPFFQYGLLV